LSTPTHLQKFHFFVGSTENYGVDQRFVGANPTAGFINQVDIGIKWVHSEDFQTDANLPETDENLN